MSDRAGAMALLSQWRCWRRGAALATSILIDHGIIEPINKTFVIDRSTSQGTKMDELT